MRKKFEMKAITFKVYIHPKNISQAFFMHQKETMRMSIKRNFNYLMQMKQKSNAVQIENKRLQINLMENLKLHLSSPHFLRVQSDSLIMLKAIK